MNRKTILHLALILSFVFIIADLPVVVFAQGGDITDNFDEDSLEGWEHSEGTQVVNGVLKISPENFIVRFDDLIPESISFDMKRTGSGVIVFRYGIGEGKEYALIFHDEAIQLEIGQEGPPQFLGESPWDPTEGVWQTVEITTDSNGQKISLDGIEMITTDEEEVLQGQGIGIWVDGESPAEFDNLTRSTTQQSAVEEPGEAPIVVPDQIAAEPTLTADELGQSSRLTINDLIVELTSSQANPTQLSTFLINLGLAVVLSFILSRVYIHWGSSLSNRRRFAGNFILLTVTTTFIILVVRSSVALSLGLVGALSIVRFRSAIKEPEELAYLFFAISIGIGLGDNQRLITVIALATAILVLGIMRLFRGRQADFNLHLTVASSNPVEVDFDSIVDTLVSNTVQMKLIRFDETNQAQEISFLVEFRDMKQLKQAKTALRGLSDALEITFLDNKGVW